MNNHTWMDISTRFSNSGIKAIFSYKSFPGEGVNGRKTLAKAVGFNSRSLIIPNQIHSTHILFCSDQGRIPECDGVFSTNPNLVCSIQVADCMPVYFAHQTEPVFGLVHAGWQGLVNGIFSDSGTVLKHHDQVLPDFEIVIGPSIQNCCFEVSDDVVNQFDTSFVEEKKNGKYRVDLQGLALDRLGRSGFIKDKIQILPDCTFCQGQRYHSYRRNGKKAGRMIGLLGMK